LADRFSHHHFNDGVVTISRNTDVPGFSLLPGVQYSYYIGVTTADTSIGALQYEAIKYRVEGYDTYQLYGRTCTLSFWVKSNKTGIYSIGLRNSGSDRSYVDEFTIYQPGVWEQKTITFQINFSGGTNNWTNGFGLQIIWTFACGSTYATPSLKTWLIGNYFSSSNQVNIMSSTDNYMQIAGVQLNIGSTAASFISPLISQELLRAQRYYEKSYNLDVNPGTATYIGSVYQPYIGFLPSTTYVGSGVIFYKVRKRATPAFHTYSPITGTIDKLRDEYSGGDLTASYILGGEQSQVVTGTMIAAAIGIAFSYNWTADAE